MTFQNGKNHLGDRNEFLPTVHGFDEFFGNLYHLNAEQEPENVDYPKNPALHGEVWAARSVLSARPPRPKIQRPPIHVSAHGASRLAKTRAH